MNERDEMRRIFGSHRRSRILPLEPCLRCGAAPGHIGVCLEEMLVDAGSQAMAPEQGDEPWRSK